MTVSDLEEHRYSALASQTRRAVLQLVIDAASPVDAAAIAASAGLHVSTVRFHLDQLEAAGLVRREPAREGRRGRPHMLYTPGASVRESEAQRQLTRVLVGAIARDPDGGHERALEAGREWAHAALPGPGSSGSSESGKLVRALDRLGFGPDEGAGDGGEIHLHACPFRSLELGDNDLVCTVHLGLLQGAAEGLGHAPEDVSLIPHVTPEVCVVKLRGELASGSVA